MIKLPAKLTYAGSLTSNHQKGSIMSKPEIRYIIKEKACLSNGEGLSGQGRFRSGEALVVKVITYSLDIDLDNIDIHYVDNREVGSGNWFVKSNVHNLSVGSILGSQTDPGDIRVVLFNIDKTSEISPELKIKLTGTGSLPDVPTDNYTGFTDIISTKTNLTLEADTVSKDVITLKTRFAGEGFGINKLNVITKINHEVKDQHLNSEGRIGVHETNIGSIYTLTIGNNLDVYNDVSLKHISLNTTDASKRYKDADQINFINQESKLIIENNDPEEYSIVLKNNIDPGLSKFGSRGIMELKGRLKIEEGSFGTQEHPLSTLAYDSDTVTFAVGATHFVQNVVNYTHDNIQMLGSELSSVGGIE